MKAYQLTDPHDVMDPEKTPEGTRVTEIWPGGTRVDRFYRRGFKGWQEPQSHFFNIGFAALTLRMKQALAGGAVVMVYVPEETD